MPLLQLDNTQRALNANGATESGALRYIYNAGTTDIVSVYSDNALSVSQANPLTADAGGGFAASYLAAGTYKIRVTTSEGSLLWERDNVVVGNDLTLGFVQGFGTLTALLADTTMDYTAGAGVTLVAADDLLRVTELGATYKVAASGAIDHHLTTAGGVKLYALPLFGGPGGRAFAPQQFGAVPADKLYLNTGNTRWTTDAGLTTAATDYTTELQTCIDEADVVLGGGGHYMVSQLQVLSNKTVRDLFLYAAPQNTDVQVSPIYLGRDSTFGRTSQSVANISNPVENVLLENIHIDGARELQTNCVSADGGRYGIRARGYHKNVRIENCSANYCATDGLEIHRGIGTLASNDDALRPQKDIWIENCTFDWNRRHGASGNGIEGLSITGCTFRNNGKNSDRGAYSAALLTPQTGAATDGEAGALSASLLYGNGVDWESNTAPGGCIRNMVMRDCILTNNIRDGVLFFNAVVQTTTGFLPSKNIRIENCRIDQGEDNVNGDFAITVSSSIAQKAGASVYEDIVISDCDIDGTVTFRSVSGASLTGGRMWAADPATTGAGTFDYATRVHFAPGLTNVNKIVAPNVADVFIDMELEGYEPYASEVLTAGTISNYILNAPGATSNDFIEVMNTGIAGATNTKVSVQHARGYGTSAAQDDQISVAVANDDSASRTTLAGQWRWRIRKASAIHEYCSDPAFASGLTASGTLTLANAEYIEGATYRIRFEATGVSGGTATPNICGTAGTAISATGRYYQDIVAGSGTEQISFTADGSWTGSIVNVSVNRIY